VKVKWTEFADIPDSFLDGEHHDFSLLRHDFQGEVIGTVREWGTTKLVVMLDEGSVRTVEIQRVTHLKEKTNA
jgi:hypothetical protein